jgi:RHS repeat-associated protein
VPKKRYPALPSTTTHGSGTREFLTDALGSTVALADSAGVPQTSYTYEPFGAATNNGAPSSNAFKYTGREDDGTGLYYYRARYYNPRLQRFVSEDPIGFAGGGINLYAHAFRNPGRYIDPTGLETVVIYYPSLATHVGIGVGTDATVGFYPAAKLDLLSVGTCGEPY